MRERVVDGDHPAGRTPTRPAARPPGLSSTLERNIQTLIERRRREEAAAALGDRMAAVITRFTGSMAFVAIHAAIFGFWTVANAGWIPGLPQWDDSFVLLATIASVEAIFLSTFVLIAQNRMATIADRRADLDLQISLLAEHEVTRIAEMVGRIAEHLDIAAQDDPEWREIQRDVAPEAVLDELEKQDDKHGKEQATDGRR
jgi:uncharacterized membrane protein